MHVNIVNKDYNIRVLSHTIETNKYLAVWREGSCNCQHVIIMVKDAQVFYFLDKKILSSKVSRDARP